MPQVDELVFKERIQTEDGRSLKLLRCWMSLCEILQIFSIVLFEKVPIAQVLTKNLLQNEKLQCHNQLLLFDL